MGAFVKLFLGATLLMVMLHPCTQAQGKPMEFEIQSISFEGNDTFSNAELLALLQTQETPGFLNKFLYNSISEQLGRKTEYLDRQMLNEDYSRLQQFYKDHGFQDVHVDTSLTFSLEDASVEILFKIQEGYRSIVDTLTYHGIVHVTEGVLQGIAADAKIVKGEPFDKALLEEEVNRVLKIVKNGGSAQARFVRDSSSVTYYTSSRNYSIVLWFDLGTRYRFGDATVQQEQEPLRDDIKDQDLFDQLDYEKGDFYSLEALRLSEKNLNRIGIFDRAWIDTRFPNMNHPESVYVSTVLRVRPRDKHELAPEILFSSDDNNNFTFGTGLGYTNRNFLGGARTFTTRLRFRTQNFRDFPDVFNANNSAIANADLTFELLQPYIFTNKIKGTWSFSAIADKQKFYINRILQNKFGITDQIAEFTIGFFDWTLQLVGLEKKAIIAADSSNPDDLRGLRDLSIQDSLQQFNSVFSYTIQRDMTNDIFSPSSGFFHSLTLEESGLIPLLLNTDRRRFTQFYRSSFLLRWYFDLSDGNRFSILGVKLKGGYEGKYGESFSDNARSIPQTHRFYAGGGGSVRGWRSRELSATGNAQFGGNILAEASMEIRINVLQGLRDDFWDRLWTVLFLDVGNVWPETKNLQVKSIATAAGIGIRYDTPFGPFRIDYGLQLYDPRGGVNGNRWITERKLWGETLRFGVIHFGLGHSF
jgi:outer membrane protein assembly factor BamA